MTWKSFIAVTLLCLPLTAIAQVTVDVAPDAASREDVRKLFDVMASREQMRQVMQQVYAQMRTFSQQELKKAHPEMTDADLARAQRQSDEFVKNFPLDDILNDMIPVYQKHFTRTDINGLIAFYSSPTGQKFLHEMPAVTAESMQLMYPRIERAVGAAMERTGQTVGPQK